MVLENLVSSFAMSAEEAIYFKARRRELKEDLLDTRKALKVAFRKVDSVLRKLQDVDLDETFDEVAELQAASGVVSRIEPVQESKAMPVENPAVSTSRKREDGHICKLPRCEEHQPFRATVREAAKLSKAQRKMWSREPAHTPEGFWNLTL
ncbi:Proline--tRNA ligase [Frankliniella fusca]|uniref:Proline--tRNA ligase n=1 Tax=Frankliniella fusca TaxID=407009 RepID=A0AAE1GPA5_9NEOP|nr:Proline--tRNA ligase [Frankliniella fusca]